MPSAVFSSDVDQVLADARRSARRMVRVDGREVEIACPFPSPADWRDSGSTFCWSIASTIRPRLRACSRTMADRRLSGRQLRRRARRARLPEHLGAGALWLSPVLKNCQDRTARYHGYGIQDFLTVDRAAFDAARHDPIPMAELRALVDEAHARGIYVILDVVLNHAGDVFEYVPSRMAAAARRPIGAGSHTAVRWRDADGRGRPDWTLAPQADSATPDAAIWPTSSGAMSCSGARARAARPAAISNRSRSS